MVDILVKQMLLVGLVLAFVAGVSSAKPENFGAFLEAAETNRVAPYEATIASHMGQEAYDAWKVEGYPTSSGVCDA